MNVMNATLGYVLCCQSPALFFAMLVLLICYVARKKNHRVRAAFDLIVALLCAASGVALYFLGMSWEYFTIRDFFHIRAIGWVGFAIVAAITVVAAVRAFLKANRRRMAEREANRANNAETFARTEEAKAANAATQAEVAEVVTEALAEETAAVESAPVDAVIPAEETAQ